jgi:branched-chain amino acid transport system substrate-binding protein
MFNLVRVLAAVLSFTAVGAVTAAPASSIKVGFLSTLSGPNAEVGQLHLEGFKLGLEAIGGKLGGIPVVLTTADDQSNPEVGIQSVRKLLDRERVDFVTGTIFSNVMMAVYKPVVDSKTFFISSFSGPSTISGEKCEPYLFGAGLQSDSTYEALGKYVTDAAKVKRVFIVPPNFLGGKDAIAGFKRYYKGEIAGELLTKLNQPDYSAEIAQIRAAKPDALYFFFPPSMAITFMRQAYAAGLRLPTYSGFAVEQTTLLALGDAGVGALTAAVYNSDLKNAENQDFVKMYVEKYKKLPSIYAALGFDAVKVLDKAVSSVGGDMERKADIRAALEKAEFKLVRGPMRFNTNHMPIQNFYLAEAVKSGGEMKLEYRGDIFTPHRDAYAANCKM